MIPMNNPNTVIRSTHIPRTVQRRSEIDTRSPPTAIFLGSTHNP